MVHAQKAWGRGTPQALEHLEGEAPPFSREKPSSHPR